MPPKKKASAKSVKSKGGNKRAFSPDKRVDGTTEQISSGENPLKRAKISSTIDEDVFVTSIDVLRVLDRLNFSDFEYDENASESDEAEETSSECGDMDIEDQLGSEPEESINIQGSDAFCDFKEEDEGDEGEEPEEDEEGFDEGPNYVGKFDLYDMHEFSDVYCPTGKSSVQPEALYEELLHFQATSENDATIIIPENYAARYDGQASVDEYGSYTLDAGTAGELKQDFIHDPYEEGPYNVIITDIEDVAWEDLKFKSKYGRPRDAWNGHGLEGELEIEGGLERCDTDRAFGCIKMRPVWRKVDGKPMEFFEGSLTFETSLNPMFARKSRTQGSKESFDFWAIRAVH